MSGSRIRPIRGRGLVMLTPGRRKRKQTTYIQENN